MNNLGNLRDFLRKLGCASMAPYFVAANGSARDILSSPAGNSSVAPTLLASFDYSGVRLLDGMLKKQYDSTRDFYFKIPDDDILLGFRKRAGLPAPGRTLPGWYGKDFFNAFGQWLSGMSRMAKATSDSALLDKSVHLMSEWAKAIGSDGYFCYSRNPVMPGSCSNMNFLGQRTEVGRAYRGDSTAAHPSALRYADIQYHQPILNRLQGEAAKDKANAEGTQPSLRQVVGIVLDEGIHRDSDTGDESGDQPYPKREGPGMLKMMHQDAADQRRNGVADRADNRSPELAARQTRATRRGIVQRRPHATEIGEYLARGDDRPKRYGKFQPEHAVKPHTECAPSDGTEKSFPHQSVVIESAGNSAKLDGNSDAGGQACCESKEKTKTEAITHSENNRVGHRSSQQSQRSVPAAQQVIREV